VRTRSRRPRRTQAVKARTRSRAYAAFGFVWVVGIVGWAVGADLPGAWKIAFIEYGGIGLADMVGIWSGKEQDDAWNRRMRRVQRVGFLAFATLLLVGALTFSD
jgi:hypothetical protein